MNIKRTLLLIFLLASMLAFQGCDTGPEYQLISGMIFRDNFDKETLANHWTLGPELRQKRDDEWSLTANPGYLTILTQKADVYNITEDPVNFFLFTVPYDNFEVTTRILFQPESNWEQAGIMLYEDKKNYSSLARTQISGKQAIEPALIENSTTTQWRKNISNLKDIYLRMTKIDNQISYFYSVEGEDWIQVGSEPYVNWKSSKVILYAVSSHNGGKNQALVDYVEIKELIWVEIVD